MRRAFGYEGCPIILAPKARPKTIEPVRKFRPRTSQFRAERRAFFSLTSGFAGANKSETDLRLIRNVFSGNNVCVNFLKILLSPQQVVDKVAVLPN